MAKKLLAQKGVETLTEIRVDTQADMREEMMARSGQRTVPQIFIGDVHVGGFDALNALNRTGALDALLTD